LSIQDSKSRPQAHRRWLVLICSLAVTVGILFFVFRGIDQQLIVRLLSTQNRGLLTVAASIILLQIILAGERWRAILSAFARGRSPPMLSVQAVFYASIFFNCLPLGTVGGDVARVWLSRRFELSVKLIVLSVLTDRIITVGALMVLAFLTLRTIAHPVAVTAWFAITTVLLSGIVGLLLLRPIVRILERWRHQYVLHLILRTADELQHLSQRGGLISLVYALLSASCAGIAVYCIAGSLGMAIGLFQMIAIVSIVSFIVALPISLAGWGVREISFVTLLGLLGVDRAAALLLSVEFGILGTLMSLPGGVIWLALVEQRRAVRPTK
jgi:glycosyltransferase 2 family protein